MALVDADKKARLVASLINKTLEGRIAWREGLSDGEFVADFTSSSISLRQHGHKEYSHLISVFNHRGDVVDKFYLEDVMPYIATEGLESQLFSCEVLRVEESLKHIPEYFYNLVRYHVMKVDDVYDGVLQELAS